MNKSGKHIAAVAVFLIMISLGEGGTRAVAQECDFGDFQRRAVATVGTFVSTPSSDLGRTLRDLAAEGERCVTSLSGFQKFLAHYLTGYVWYSVGVAEADARALVQAESHFREAAQSYDVSFARDEMLQTARLMIGWSLARRGDLSGDLGLLGRAAEALTNVGQPLRTDAVFLRGLVHLRQAEILFRSALAGAVGAPLDSAVASLRLAVSDLNKVQEAAQSPELRAAAAYWAGEGGVLRAKVQASLALQGKGTLLNRELGTLSAAFDRLTRNRGLDALTRQASQIAWVYTQMASAVARLLNDLDFNVPRRIDLNSVGIAGNPADFCGSLPQVEATSCLTYFGALFGLRPGLSLEGSAGELAFWSDWAKLHNFMVFGNVWNLGMSVPNLASWFSGTDAHVRLENVFTSATLPGAQEAVAREYQWARAVVKASLGNPVLHLPSEASQIWPATIGATLQNVAPLSEVSRQALNLIAPPAPLPALAVPERIRESIQTCMALGGLLGRRWYRYAFFLLQYSQAREAFGPLQPVLSALARYLGSDAAVREAIASQSHQELWQIYRGSHNPETKFAALSALAVIHLFQGDLCDSGPGQDVASACHDHAAESPLFAYAGQYFCNISDLSNRILQVARCQVEHYPDLGYQWWNFKVQAGPVAATCESPATVQNEYRADWWVPEFSHLSPTRKLYISLRHRLAMFWLALSPAPGMPTLWRPDLLAGLRTPGPTEFRVQARIPVSLEFGLPGVAKHVVLTMNEQAVLNETVTDASLDLECFSGQPYGVLVWAEGRWPRFVSVIFSAPGETKRVDLVRAPQKEPTGVKTYESDPAGRMPLWWQGNRIFWAAEGGYSAQIGSNAYEQSQRGGFGVAARAIQVGGETLLLNTVEGKLLRPSDGRVFAVPEKVGRVRDVSADEKHLYVLGENGKLVVLTVPDLSPKQTFDVSPLSISVCRLPGSLWIGDLDGPVVWSLSEDGNKFKLPGSEAAVADGLIAPSRILYDPTSKYAAVVDLLCHKLFFFLPNGEYVGSIVLPSDLDWDWLSWSLGRDGLRVRFGVPGAIQEAAYPPGAAYAFRPARSYEIPEQPPTIPTGGWIVVRTTW